MKTRNASREFPGPNGKPLIVEILTSEAAVVVREKHERDGCKFTVHQLWAMAQKLKKGSLELTEPRAGSGNGPSLITVPHDAVITEQSENRTTWSFGTNHRETWSQRFKRLNPFRK